MNCEKKKNSLVVSLDGEIDHHSVEKIKGDIDNKFDIVNAKNIIFDFSNVSFMDSAGIGLIIGRCKRVALMNGQAAVVGASEYVNRILDISGIYKITYCCKSVHEALKNMD